MKRENRKLRRLLLPPLLILACTSFVSSPALFLLMFRVRHPASNAVEFAGFRFLTPFRWIAIGNRQVVVITRRPLWLFASRARGTILLDATLERLPDLKTEDFYASVERTFKKSSLVQSRQSDFLVEGEQVLCVEGKPAVAGDSTLSANCFFPRSHDFASYSGDAAYSSVFYNLLSGFKKLPTDVKNSPDGR